MNAKPVKLTKAQLAQWDEKGYIILKGFFSDEEVNKHNAFVDSLWLKRIESMIKVPCDIYLKTPQEIRIPFYKVADDVRNYPYKLNDLYLEYDQARELCLDASLGRILKQLLQGSPAVINSLNMEYGTQQSNHIDTFYMPPFVENKMLATWIALDNADSKNGPLRIYPRSHKIPPYRFSNGQLKAIGSEMPKFNDYISVELEKRSIKPMHFIAQPGDVLIWHAQLLHGGEEIIENRTRKSLVTHYFRSKDLWRRFWRLRIGANKGIYLQRAHQSTA